MIGGQEFSKRKFSKSPIVFWVGLVVIVAFAILSLYLLLFSLYFANTSQVIPIRRDFYEHMLEKHLLPSHLPYIAYVRNVEIDGEEKSLYEYAMMGRYEGMETTPCVLKVRDKRGMVWRWGCESQTYPAVEGAEYRNLMVVETQVASGGAQSNSIKYHLYHLDGEAAEMPYLAAGDMVRVLWQDERTLASIREELREQDWQIIPLSVLPKGKGIIPLYKIVGEGE